MSRISTSGIDKNLSAQKLADLIKMEIIYSNDEAYEDKLKATLGYIKVRILELLLNSLY